MRYTGSIRVIIFLCLQYLESKISLLRPVRPVKLSGAREEFQLAYGGTAHKQRKYEADTVNGLDLIEQRIDNTLYFISSPYQQRTKQQLCIDLGPPSKV